jgi:F0F1-type ATP synthase assembly protein I
MRIREVVMHPQDSERRQLGIYFAIAQVGTEMVAPAVLGVWLDSTYGWAPWATIIGVVFGFVSGIMHLVILMKRAEQSEASRRKGP